VHRYKPAHMPTMVWHALQCRTARVRRKRRGTAHARARQAKASDARRYVESQEAKLRKESLMCARGLVLAGGAAAPRLV